MLPTRRPSWQDVALLILGYVALDWASHIHPIHDLNITPWNPAPALALVFLLQFGKWATVPTVVAIVLAETWVRGLPVAFPITVGLAILLTGGYVIIAAALSRFLGGNLLSDNRSLLLWSVIVGVGTLLNSALFVATLHQAGYVPGGETGAAVFQYWVGDTVGVLVAMPLLWMLMDEHRRSQLREIVARKEFLADLLVALASLLIAFGLGESRSSNYLYALFLPVAWAASRRGLSGAVIAAATIQVGIIVAIQSRELETLTVLEIQILAAAIALFGFFIGIVVDEKERVSNELRQTLRLAAAGEMAGALAHELNQPLTALSTYGSACEQLLARGETGPRLRDAVDRMVRESFHAAEVLRRLRDFFRTGTTRLEEVALERLVADAVSSVAAKAERESVAVSVSPVPACRLLGDPAQLEVVLRNLLTNAIDAVGDRPTGERRIDVGAVVEGGSRVCISVEDSGPGFSEAQMSRLFEGLQSTKASGMGLGLVISRAIAEAHGGHLWAEVGDHGIFRLNLPIEETLEHAI